METLKSFHSFFCQILGNYNKNLTFVLFKVEKTTNITVKETIFLIFNIKSYD